jgi:nucleoside-diphosphate-sugar epimerase
MTILFGASGLIGSEILAVLSQDPAFKDENIHRIRWQDVEAAGADAAIADIRRRTDLAAADGRVQVVFANGITDPRRDPADLAFSNVDFPLRAIRETSADRRIRYLTIGTIQENFPDLCRGNPYLNSKYRLGAEIASLAARPELAGRLLHVRLHTLYGRQVKPHMFLGQMILAIREGRQFSMSSGVQLREYHHVEDVARGFVSLLKSDWRDRCAVEMNSGQPVRLSDLATHVFRSLDLMPLLKISELASPAGENTGTVFVRSPDWILPHTREPFAGVLQFVRESTR